MSSNDTLHVIAKIKAKAGQDGALRGMLQQLVLSSQKEDGCSHYQLFEEPKAPGSFWTYEQWADQAALDKHMAGLGPVMEKAGPLFDGAPDIRVTKPV